MSITKPDIQNILYANNLMSLNNKNIVTALEAIATAIGSLSSGNISGENNNSGTGSNSPSASNASGAITPIGSYNLEVYGKATVLSQGFLQHIQAVNFPNATSVRSLSIFGNLSDAYLPNVTSIADGNNAAGKNVFPQSLRKIHAPRLTNIGDEAFIYCSNLTDIYLPNILSIGSNAFKGTSLRCLFVGNTPPSVEQGAFEGLDIYVKYPASEGLFLISNGHMCAYQITYDPYESYTEEDLPIGNYEYELFGSATDLAFDLASYPSEDYLPIQAVNFPYATCVNEDTFKETFQDLSRVNLPNATLIKDEAFYHCSALQEISLPKAETLQNSAFYNCFNLSNVFLPEATCIYEYTFGVDTSCPYPSTNLTITLGSIPPTVQENSFHGRNVVVRYPASGATNWANVINNPTWGGALSITFQSYDDNSN